MTIHRVAIVDSIYVPNGCTHEGQTSSCLLRVLRVRFRQGTPISIWRSVMTTSERKAVLRFNRRRLFLNRMIMQKRAFISSIRKALQSQGTASIGSL